MGEKKTYMGGFSMELLKINFDLFLSLGFGKMIHNLIEDGMTADQKNNEWTALHWAANEGDVIFSNSKFTY